jgi:hypothetical protein
MTWHGLAQVVVLLSSVHQEGTEYSGRGPETRRKNKRLHEAERRMSDEQRHAVGLGSYRLFFL